MADQTKRMNYFDRQFLRASDFQVEQAYHLDRRRRHNRLLHTNGVAEGLDVSGSNKTFTVTNGTAIDVDGQEIVLSDDRTGIEMPDHVKKKTAIIYIAYADRFLPNDSTTEGGVTGNPRITESPAINILPENEAPPRGYEPLAKASVGEDGTISMIDTTVRRHVGTKGAITVDDLTVRSLTLKQESVDQSQWPKLSFGGVGTPEDPHNVALGVPASSLPIGGLSIDVGSFDKSTNAANSYFFRVRDTGVTDQLNRERNTIFKIRGDGNVRLYLPGPSPGKPNPLPVSALSVEVESFGTDANAQASYYFRACSFPTNVTECVPIFYIRGDGNVGIGTASPNSKLEVNGNIGYTYGTGAAQDNFLYVGAAGSLANATGSSWQVKRSYDNIPLFTIKGDGNVSVAGSITSGGGKGGYVMDQFINKLGEALEEGDVVVIGGNQSVLSYGQYDNIPIPEVDLTQEAYDTAVCGIVSEVHGELKPSPEEGSLGAKAKSGKKKAKLTPQPLAAAEMEKQERTQVQPGQIGWMVTLGAFAHCKVDADIAPIKIGDLLTTSPTKGHAQKVADPSKAVGAILGKALGSLKKGKGKIPILVMLQ